MDQKNTPDMTPKTRHIPLSTPSTTTPEDDCDIISDSTPIKISNKDFPIDLQMLGRLAVFLTCVIILLLGRNGVPDNEQDCITDKVHSVFKFANDFINSTSDENSIHALQLFCSIFVDSIFFATFIYWIFYGKTNSFPITLSLFLFVRMFVVMIWYSPFPEGFSHRNPGIPSLLIPFGEKRSNFFFSQYIGVMVICAREWGKLGKIKARNTAILSIACVIAMSLSLRTHYFIDVFTAIFFGDWCHERVDWTTVHVESSQNKFLIKFKGLFGVSKRTETSEPDSTSLKS